MMMKLSWCGKALMTDLVRAGWVLPLPHDVELPWTPAVSTCENDLLHGRNNPKLILTAA